MELLDSWLRSLRAAGRSPGTLDAYAADVRHFAAFLDGRDLEEVTRRDVEEFLVAGMDRGLAAATTARRYRSLQQFYKWLEVEDEIEKSPMAAMSPPKVPIQPPPVITDSELAALLAACRTNPGKARHANESERQRGEFERRRDTAIVSVMVTTGVRSAELIGLTLGDLHLDAETFTVLGKGGRSRVVALMPQAAEALDRYLRARRRHPNASSPALWLGEKGRLTDSGLRQLLERRCEQAGIRRINPHLFRHTFAHMAKARGMADDALMSVAGWQSNQMLARYGASAAAERGRELHRRLFADVNL
jgi:site-specific recombinase XerD